MKKVALFFMVLLFLFTKSTQATYDPLSRSNNLHGIHILFTTELDAAESLVNSTNGEWGYVTIPIQITDLDLIKWQEFMDKCREKRLIPIIRLATEPYYKNTAVWRKPSERDVIDFANFLNSLNWPTENRYVIIFNEVNRFDEWGGESPNPERYSQILSFAVDAFKRRNDDFYIIMAGMDNASPNDRIQYMDNMVYIEEMIKKNPDAIKKLDGFSSHSYPNPGFSQPPDSIKEMGTATYKYEYELINSISDKKIPAFITETGWVTDNLSSETISEYYKTAYESVWGADRDKIVAVTPFLLNSNGEMFRNFSFMINGQPTTTFETAKNISKTKGEPIETAVKGEKTVFEAEKEIKKFVSHEIANTNVAENLLIEYVKIFF